MGLYKGFWESWEKANLFSGIWGEVSFIFRDLRSLSDNLDSREQGSDMHMKKNPFLELWRKVIFFKQ